MLTNIKNLKISKKSILIFGITGQDGSLLAKEYLNKDFKVFGVITSKFFSPINLKKLNILKKQRTDLSHSFDELLLDYKSGVKKMKVYRQMKMYNDSTLNPELYQKNKP